MFQNQSDFNQEVVIKVYKIITLKRKIFGFVFCAFMLSLSLIFVKNDLRELGFFFFFIGFVFLAFEFITFSNLKRRLKETSKKACLTFFDFDADTLKITESRNDVIIGFTRLEYQDIHKIEEYKDHVLIHMVNTLFFIMEKDKMTEGDFYSLRTFLYNKFGSRYKTKQKDN